MTMALGKEHLEEATKLLQERPPVVPGTRAIIDRNAAKAWYDRVTLAMEKFSLTGRDVYTFCALAGVPD